MPDGFLLAKGDISVYRLSLPGRGASLEAREAQDGQGMPLHSQAQRGYSNVLEQLVAGSVAERQRHYG